MILKPQQRKALERALASTRELEDKLAYLEQIAEHSPLYQERVRQLRERQQYNQKLAQVAITADSTS